MGGEAAKERRRLKRLKTQQGADGTAAPSGEKSGTSNAVAKSEKSVDKESGAPATRAHVEKGSVEAVRLRLRRKMARKASGKFKAHSSESAPRSSPRTRMTNNDSRGKTSKSPNPPPKMLQRSPRNQSFQRNASVKNKFGKQKEKQPVRRNNNSKQKAKNKPKHLKRKMDQISKTISEGSNGGAGTNLSDLEGKMKQLVEQMEKYKKLKENKAANDKEGEIATDEPGKESVENGQTAEDATDDAAAFVEDDKENETGNKDDDDPDSSPSGEGDPSKSDEERTDRSSPKSSSSGSSDDESDEDVIAESSNDRSRGKRRRGRRDNKPNEQSMEGGTPDVASDGAKGIESKASPEVSQGNLVKTSAGADGTSAADSGNGSPQASKKTSKKDDKRRCIGRKPITDYVVGETYPGKVKYIKPQLGAFIDIGSHSDAFCHISCTSDDFVSSVADVLRVGDAVEGARVVEINRERKRITVSLRSEEMAENEKERLRTTRRYEKGLTPRSGSGGGGSGDAENEPATSKRIRFDASECEASARSPDENAIDEDGSPAGRSVSAKSNVDPKRERKLARRAERRAGKGGSDNPPAEDGIESRGRSAASPADQSGPGRKSGADLKRERKLARRAERRAAREAGG